MYCENCGKEINENAVVCPYCGTATKKLTETEKKLPVNGIGIAGFVVSLLSLWLGVYFCIASIVGVALSAVAMATRSKHSLNGLAIAGLVISIVSLVIWGLIWIIVGAAIIAIL